MELRTLKYFVHVADARSFSHAAVHLRVAQSALSRQIGKLEGEVGAPLFLRTGRRLELTEAGELLLTRARALLANAANSLEEVRAFGSELSGTLIAGLTPAICEILAPIILRGCAARHPGVRVRFVEGFSSLMIGQLLNQELTLCVLHNPPAHKAIAIRRLLTEPMYLAGPAAGHGLAPASPGMDLAALPMILPNKTHPLRALLEEALGGGLDVAIQTDGVITTRALVEAGLGYTILPYSAMHRQVQTGRISCVRLDNLSIPWTLCLAARNDQRATRLIDAVLAIIEAQKDVIAGVAPGRDRRDARPTASAQAKGSPSAPGSRAKARTVIAPIT